VHHVHVNESQRDVYAEQMGLLTRTFSHDHTVVGVRLRQIATGFQT
jgi:hypothetical protein